MGIIYYTRNNPVCGLRLYTIVTCRLFKWLFQGLHSFTASNKGHEGRGSSYAVGCHTSMAMPRSQPVNEFGNSLAK